MEEAEVPLEHLHEHAREGAEHSDQRWISWVVLSTAVLAVLAAIAGLLSGKHANEAIMRQIEASGQWNYYQAKSIKAAVLGAKMPLAGRAAQSGDALVSKPPEKSIAVLPFNDFTDKKGTSHLAQTLQDQILANLAETPGLRVISREWVMRYKPGVNRDSREIGTQLGVTYLLEGSVRSAGNRVAVNAELIDTRTDERVVGETYDRYLSELSSIETDLVEQIVSEITSETTDEKHSNGALVSSDREKASKYQKEEAEIKSEAERKESQAKTHFHKHEVLARGVTMFQIAIAIAAISALTQKRRLWTVSLVFGAVGCIFLVLGFFAR